MLDDLSTGIDIIIYQKARALLGLPQASWKRPSFARLEACAIRFADIERLAQRRAGTLKRLLDQADPFGAYPAHAAFASEDRPRARCAAPSIFLFVTLPVSAHTRAGLRVRAPP